LTKTPGVPIAFILFTARPEAAAVHADYNTAILTELLGLYKKKMPKNEHGEIINVKVAITDMDPRERAAVEVWVGRWVDQSGLGRAGRDQVDEEQMYDDPGTRI
jgi:hypothetical protein